MKHVYDRDFKYTRAKDQGPNYLAEKFKRIRREQQEAIRKEREAKVQPLPKRGTNV